MDGTYDEVKAYFEANPLAVVGTTNLDGSPHGAVVYVCADDARHTVYFLTKTETRKYKNLEARDKVSLTITNPEERSTLQADGRAATVHDSAVREKIIKKISNAHATAAEWLPPIAKLNAGTYVVVAVDVWHARIARYKGMTVGDEHIFAQV